MGIFRICYSSDWW